MDILEFDVKSRGTRFARVICESSEELKEAKALFRSRGYKFQADPYLNCLRGFYEAKHVMDFFSPETRPQYGLIFRKKNAFKPENSYSKKDNEKAIIFNRQELLDMLEKAK